MLPHGLALQIHLIQIPWSLDRALSERPIGRTNERANVMLVQRCRWGTAAWARRSLDARRVGGSAASLSASEPRMDHARQNCARTNPNDVPGGAKVWEVLD